MKNPKSLGTRLGLIAGVHLHPHRWWHTFATDLLSKGVPVSEVESILGNSPRSSRNTMVSVECPADSVSVEVRQAGMEGSPEWREARSSPEQIVNVLRQIEVAIANGKTARAARKEAGFTEQTYYGWRKEYGGLKVNQAKRPAARGIQKAGDSA